MALDSPHPGDPCATAHPAPQQPTLREAILALRKLYASLPTLTCKGLCAHSCVTVIDMSHVERDRIERLIDQRLPETMRTTKGAPCPLLTPDGTRCGVHRVRPMICRMWGMSRNPEFRCPHGCEPDRWLTDVDVITLLMDSYEAGGPPGEGLSITEIRPLLQDPAIASLITRRIAGNATPDELYEAVRVARSP